MLTFLIIAGVMWGGPPHAPAATAASSPDDAWRREIAAARDDDDDGDGDGEFREQAFFALVEHVRRWPHSPAIDGEAIRLTLDVKALIASPAEYRGELFRIRGERVQSTRLPPPYEDVSEWFVRDARSNQPVMVYVVDPPSAASAIESNDRNQRRTIEIDARFYKRMRMIARDGQERTYPAFVGRFSAFASAGSNDGKDRNTAPAGPRPAWMFAVPVGALALLFILMRRWAARARRGEATSLVERKHQARHQSDRLHAVDDARDLPDDPAEALAELRRRVEGLGERER